jgi:uncharacterized phage protein (TIGR01671 family)
VKIKIRAWDKEYKFMTEPFYLGSVNAGDGYDPDWEPMLYTGMKDKNGVEICEGDIVSFSSDENCFLSNICDERGIEKKRTIRSEVFFANGCFSFDYQCGFEGIEVWWDKIEVIGNIYENHELLTEDKEN